MALILKDRVQETTTTTGTGTLTLGGAVTGYQSFSAIGNANTTYYAIYAGSEWEVGIGTYTASGTTLSRDTVLSSSNSGSLVSFSAGTKNVWCDYPAGKAVYTDSTGAIPSPTITTPVIAQINDANGNAELKFSVIASAVNQVTIENAATGNPVHISATGTDASIGIHLAPKGASGYINVQGGVDSTKRLMFNPDGGTTSTRTMLSTSQTVDRTLTLPDATDTLVGKATTDTLTNKSISGSTNTLTNIANSSLTNSAITINGTSTSLGGSISVGTVTSVTGTSPVVSSGGNTPAISMPAATTSVNGYLTSTDWNTFNNKGSGTVTSVSATAPITSSGGATPNLAMPAATTSVNGYLTSTDWTTFNNKGSGTVTSVAALTLGTTGTDLSSTVATGTTTPVITLQVPTASATNRGALSAADWTTFNNKGSGTITSVTGTAPVVSSGGATPAISMAAATTSVSGYLTSTDWTTFNGKQAVLVSGTNIKTINTNSILGSGDLTISATPAGSTTQVQYNNAGALGASSAFTFASSTLIAPNLTASNGIVSNNATVGASFTIASGYNAMSVGPVTVASGQAVTVPSGSRWVIL